MFSRRGPILIAVSVLLAVAAAWAAHRWLQAQTNKPEAGPGTVPVVVAATDIPFGTKVEARNVALIQMLQGTVPDGAYASPAAVEGKVARASVLKGEILLKERFVEQGAGSTLAAVVADNMRAVSVRVDDVIGVAGFLLPGNHVDVISAYKEGGKTQSETVVQNVRVLAVDQTASTDKSQPVIVRAVTLEVTPEDAEKLIAAKQRGAIQLALRNPADSKLAEAPKATQPAAAAVPAPAPAAVKPRLRKGPPPATQSVTVIRGTDVGTEAPKANRR